MSYRSSSVIKLNSEFTIPQVALGTWKAGPEECYDAVKSALNAGYRHIDTARIYLNEDSVGRAINDFLEESEDIQRSDLFITTKISPCDYRDVETAILGSLERLQLDYVDLYLMHHSLAAVSGEGLNPVDENGFRKHIPFEEFSYIDAYKSVEKCVEKGYTKSIGVCNFNVPKVQRLVEVATIPPAVVQCEIHPYLPQHDLIEFCNSHGIVVEAYSPFGSTGAPLLDDPVLTNLAKKYDVSPACIAISWAVARGSVPLPKSTNPKRIEANLHIVDLNDTDIELIDDIHKTTSKRYLNPPWKLDVYNSDAEFKTIC
uniref:Aldo-keto reductase n=1 Tax=Cyberlindnera americana TaxID=36016 RepID=A0A5P8N9K3_9ASCO|nr:aldo-keto reductase [Cyberlindnera americana]